MYEINRDVFCGAGQRVLYFMLVVVLAVGVPDMNSYAAQDDCLVDKKEELDVILYDSLGRKILIKNGTDWGVSEDIIMVIPVEEISESGGEIMITYKDNKKDKVKKYVFGCNRR